MPTQPRRQPTRAQGLGFQASLEHRRVDLERKQNDQVAPFIVSGLIETFGIGNGQAPVQFPVSFLGRPSLSGGGEVISGSVSSSSLPLVSVSVLSWVFDPRAPADPSDPRAIFLGAQLAVVVDGPDDLHMYVHWSVSGKALRRAGGADGEF